MNTQVDAEMGALTDERSMGFLPLAPPSLAVVRPGTADAEGALMTELLTLVSKLGLAAAVEVLRATCAESPT